MLATISVLPDEDGFGFSKGIRITSSLFSILACIVFLRLRCCRRCRLQHYRLLQVLAHPKPELNIQWEQVEMSAYPLLAIQVEIIVIQTAPGACFARNSTSMDEAVPCGTEGNKLFRVELLVVRHCS